MDRVKFYSTNDLSYSYYLECSEKVIINHRNDKKLECINDVIELYNIQKYFDNEIYLTRWKSNDIKKYKDIAKTFMPIIARFFVNINIDKFDKYYEKIDFDYRQDFWELIVKFNLYQKIDPLEFEIFLYESKVNLHEILIHRGIAKYFGCPIREYMLFNKSSAEVLLDEYEIKHNTETNHLFFPNELTNADKEVIICNYLDNEQINFNYLKIIANIQSNKNKVELSPKTLLKAKKRLELEKKKLFPEDSGILLETTLIFSDTQEEEVKIEIEGYSIKAIYSTKWIEENRDSATLLNNFIYLFDYVDFQMRFNLVNKSHYMGVLERYMFIKSKNAYIKGGTFNRLDQLSLMQMTGYYNKLLSIDIRIEELIEWFFKDYLSHEFEANNFKLNMPSTNSTFLEKCTNIMPALESVLKQFLLFVEEGHIDFELLEFSSDHLIYKNIPSLVQRKYVYGYGDEFRKLTIFLFSDQSSLGFIKKLDKSYRNLFELISNEEVVISSYSKHNIQKINWLIEHEYLLINNKGFLEFSNNTLITILKDLYYNEVISYWKYPNQGQEVIDELEKKHIVKIESSLFTKPEQDYINYFLNKSQFNNGLDLRNKYVHTQPDLDNEFDIHKHNYMVLLRIFILTILKINDDFCIADYIKNR